MQNVSSANFGLVVAYLVPGAMALLGLSPFSPLLHSWFAASPSQAPTVAGFLYLTVASLAAGMIVSAVRWLVIDAIHNRTGIPRPAMDFSRLPGAVDAFRALIAVHYDFYLFFANSLVAGAWCYALWRGSQPLRPLDWPDLAFAALAPILMFASRDALRNYYTRTAQLLAGPTRPTKADDRSGGR